ncbi:STAS domain-containing protein [Micromonospora carbonacea]|uniref:Anti-anti-sigma factor n=1 Tax=Micromonospora carbonacea TaxID=47853 RepID=A0A1C4YLT1_9ACTN|nr:STAS domain-containing protein [Micromonospora carbonacea]SCF21664.1 anti-anti-sigma factor [Micromonospora carbonacea]
MTGEIDIATSGELAVVLAALLDGAPPAALELDFGGVRFLDSSGILVLLRAQGRAADQGCRLTLADVRPTVHRVLEITGVLELLGLGVPAAAADDPTPARADDPTPAR